MTRSGGAGILAVCVLAAAWVLGSTALAILGVGLGLATLAARGWARFVASGLTIERRPIDGPPIEGDPLLLEAELVGRSWLASRVEWRDRVGALGEQGAVVASDGRACLELPRMPRGRYHLGPGRLRATDPLGLTRVEVPVERESTLTVRPRVPELGTLFTETGAWGEGGRRALVRRPSGLEPHGVREYQEGEPLRAVHWPTSARRGELMVRELEDAPRDSIAVVLDTEASTVAGERGDSSLDDAVRAAAGIVRAHALRSRRALLVIGAPQPGIHAVRSVGRDWDQALDALAAVEPAAATPLRDLVAARGPLGSVPELVVVTARPEAVADALVARSAVGRSSALVAVDAPTYAGRPAAGPSAVMLRLAAAGVALTVLRHGTPLVEALGGLRARAVG
jgi:uncharacterized protein (DUF58 family)